ncbi:MAG: hypothetical protein M1820_000230 [Bogoriella megaspora]|nr:MAG: hypothetical protein M1820_000230 [Bogoriella megaspora]
MVPIPGYDLIVVGSGFAGCTTTLNFLKHGRVALIEVGKSDERCGASRWTMAYLRLDKDLGFDEDWKHEMQSRRIRVEEHGVKFNHHDEQNVLLEFKTAQHFVFPEGGGNAIISKLMEHINGYDSCDIYWETEGRRIFTTPQGEVRGLQVRKKEGWPTLRAVRLKT